MKQLMVLIMASFGALLLAACNPSTTGNSNGADVLNNLPNAQATLVDEKVLYAAEAAYFGANTIATAAVEAKTLTPGSTQAVAVADGLLKAKELLDRARAAHKLANSDYVALANDALAAIAEVQKLLQPIK